MRWFIAMLNDFENNIDWFLGNAKQWYLSSILLRVNNLQTFLIGNIKIHDKFDYFCYVKNTTFDTIHLDVLDTIHKNDTDKTYSMTRAAQ